MSDSIQMIAENTAKVVGGRSPGKRLFEIVNPQKEELRSPEQVKKDMLRKLQGGE